MKKTKIIVSLALLVLFTVFSPLISVAISANEQVTPSDVEIAQQVETTQITPSSVASVEQVKPAALQSRALLPNEVIVTTFAQFKSAVETANNGITTIYFGADITMTGSIAINPAKANIIIDGTDPNTGIMYILTEVQSAAVAGEIYLSSTPATPATIVLRNVIVTGYNYYGTITIYDAVQNQTVRYENIDYTGPQMIYHTGGTTQIANSNITILTQYTAANEVGEVKNLQLEGNVNIDHQTAATYNVFNFYGSNAGSLVVKSGANVDIKTRTTLGYGGYGYTQEADSTVTIHQLAGGASILNGNGYNYNFNMGKDSVLNLSQEYATATGVMLYWYNASNLFQVSGGTINLTSTGTRSNDLIYVGKTTLSDATITAAMPSTFANSVFNSYGTSTLTMNNSNITATIAGAVTSAAGILFNNAGPVFMTNSQIVMNAKSSIAANVINLGNTTLTGSTLSANVTGSMLTTTTAAAAIKTGTLSMTSSNINASVSGTVGTLLAPIGTLKIDAGSSVKLYAYNSGAPVLYLTSSITVINGGALNIEVVNSQLSQGYLLQTPGNITFDVDANVQLILRGGPSVGIIYMSSTTPTIKFNDPASVVFYTPSLTQKVLNNSYDINFTINAQQVNQWNVASSYSSSVGISPNAKYHYAKKDKTNYSIVGRLTSGPYGVTTITSSNFEAGDGANPTGTLTFTSSANKAFSVGKFAATSVQPTTRDTKISGTAPAGSTIHLVYTSGGTQYTVDQSVDATGTYLLEILPIDYITYTLTTNYLTLSQVTSQLPLPYLGYLQFVNVPTQMAFQTTDVPTQTTLIQRVDPAWSISIKDDRGDLPHWELRAMVVTPLTPSDASKPSINNAFVFVDTNNQKHYLSTSTPTSIQTTTSGSSLVNTAWAASQGMLLEINQGSVYSGMKYTGVIEWSLISAP